MPLPQRRHPAAAILAMSAALVGTVALARYVERSRLRSLEVDLDKSARFEDLEYALPTGWAPAKTGRRMDIASALSPPPAKPDAASAQGPRQITISLERPGEPLPTLAYLVEHFVEPASIRPSVSGAELAGHHAQRMLCEIIFDGRKGVREVLSSVLPSGRVLSVRMDGAGRFTRADELTFEGTCKALSLGDESSDSSDPFLRLRYLTAAPAEALRAAPASAPPLDERVTVRSGNAEIAVAAYPVYLPPPGEVPATRPSAGDPGAAPGPGGDVVVGPPTAARLLAESVARQYACLHEPGMEEARAEWISPTRLSFVLPVGPGQSFPARTLVVWPTETARDGVLLTGLGTPGSESAVAQALTRAADALPSDLRIPVPRDPAAPEAVANDPAAFIAAGVRLAQRLAAEPPPTDLALLWKRSGGVIGWTKLSRTQVESRRTPSLDEPTSAAVATTYFNHGLRAVTQTQYRFIGDRLVPAGRTGAEFGVSPLRIGEPSALGERMAMSGPETLIPFARLLSAAPLAGTEPALVCTDTVPWLQLETRPPRWHILILPAPGQAGAWTLHVLGTSLALRCRYAPDNALLSAELTGTGETAMAYRDMAAFESQLPQSGILAP